MSKFQPGDKVKMGGVPFVVEVLEIGICEDADRDFCPCPETIRFKDPGGQGDDWAHADEFVLVGK